MTFCRKLRAACLGLLFSLALGSVAGATYTPLSSSSVTETGATNIVTVPFPYINQSDVSVYVNGVLTTAYTWLTSSTIQMTASAASLSGDVILLVRNTQVVTPDVTFAVGSLDPNDLNTAGLQALYGLQEAQDRFERGIFYGPGYATSALPSPASCANDILGFDGTGLIPTCYPYPTLGSTFIGAPGISVPLLTNPYFESASNTLFLAEATSASATVPSTAGQFIMDTAAGGTADTFAVALFVANTCSAGAGNCYGFNSVMDLASGYGNTFNALNGEFDCNNAAGDFNDAAGAPNYPLGYCLFIAGGSGPYQLGAMLAINSNGISNRGIVIYGGAYTLDTIEDFSASQSTLRIAGAHTYGINGQGSTFSGAFALVPNNSAVAWLTAAGTSNLNLLILDSSNNFQIGNGANEIYTTVPEYIESATSGTGLIVGNVTHPIAGLYGFGTGNDGGGLGLDNGGVALIQLVASSSFASYIDGFNNAQGLSIGTTAQAGAGNLLVHGSAKVAGLPTSAGGGGLYICIDTTGQEYKKASCP